MNTDRFYLSSNIQVSKTDSGLVISIPWFYSRYGIAFVLVIVISLFAYFQFKTELNDPNAWPITFTMIPLYIALFYFFLTKFFNYTEIIVTEDGINTRHKPLPLRKGAHISWNNVRGVVVDEKFYQGRTRREYYEVSVIKNTGRLPVVTYLEQYGQANYIQYELRQFFEKLSNL